MQRSSRTLYWGTCFARADLGGWTWARIRPWWYWRARQAWLFVRIVWRRYEDSRIDAGTAWEVAGIANRGLASPVRVRRGPVDETILAAEVAAAKEKS